MPVELGIWRIDQSVKQMQFIALDLESRLQDILANDISIADPNLMVIGCEVKTSFDKRIDLLAINRDGNLVVIELKRDKTPRDIVAQTLEYGAWVRELEDDDIARIFDDYQKKHHPERAGDSIDKAFCKHFGISQIPDQLNENHELVIVASHLDVSTERIVQYLADEYDVHINAVFFRVFKDDDREYLSRAWLREPGMTDSAEPDRKKGEWNGEYYVSFGTHEGSKRNWAEARKYGFICAGGGAWYSNTLSLLEPGARIWVNIPGTGYVGVGEVTEPVVPVDDFQVDDGNGKVVPITALPLDAAEMIKVTDNPEKGEYLVRVKWIKTVSTSDAIKEKGFFGNQNSVARPTAAKWDHTVERLKKRFDVK